MTAPLSFHADAGAAASSGRAPAGVSPSFAGRGCCLEWKRSPAKEAKGAAVTLVSFVTYVTFTAFALLGGVPAWAQTAPTHPSASPSTAPHKPSPRAKAPHAASGSSASSAPADADERLALPRLIAIATSDNDDDIPRFALYAARDIEQLGLQFPAQTANAAPDSEVVITMRLRDSATARMRDFSRQHMNEPMTLIVDGVEMLTATIRSELGGKFQLQLPKEKARLLFQRVLAKAGPAT
ncbi:hypothetical protein [Pandoraea capi]|uniref:hypothetical protein n=1 Tax=Pandoraea capi TaxID=2508286 RepID=UPI0012430BFB|nr:hypothetical protein [Pandoraea capi]